MCARDVIFAQPGAYRCPCRLEFGLAVFEVAAVAVSARAGFAVHGTAPRPLCKVSRQGAGLHDPPLASHDEVVTGPDEQKPPRPAMIAGEFGVVTKSSEIAFEGGGPSNAAKA